MFPRNLYRYCALTLVLGHFSGASCSKAGGLTAEFAAIAAGSNVDLTVMGSMDWVHWGLYTESSKTRKTGVPEAISDFSLIGNTGAVVVAYQYSDNWNGYTWYDGWPTESHTNTPTGVWAYQASPAGPAAVGFGFELRVPADVSPRRLYLFVGAFAAGGELRAFLSDGTTGYTNSTLFNSSNGPGGVYVLDYQADLSAQTLTVQWVLSQRAPGLEGLQANVTLQAAALAGLPGNNPPIVHLIAPQNFTSFQEPVSVLLEADAQDVDGTVTNVVFYAGTNQIGETASSPFTLNWEGVPSGHYFLMAAATDDQGATRQSRVSELFVYGSAGTLIGSASFPPESVDLTSQGTTDWMQWGALNHGAPNRKNGVSPALSMEVLGANVPQNDAAGFTTFAWSDGTPMGSNPGTNTAIFITGLTNGFVLRAPADSTPRTLRLYASLYGAQAEFEAYLSDFSAPPFTDASLSSIFGNAHALYELNYSVAAPGQELIALLRTANLFDFEYGNVALQAATLQASPSSPLPFSIENVHKDGTNVSFSFNTEQGHDYLVQYTDSLSQPLWTTLTNVTGTGSSVEAMLSNANGQQGFYRVEAH